MDVDRSGREMMVRVILDFDDGAVEHNDLRRFNSVTAFTIALLEDEFRAFLLLNLGSVVGRSDEDDNGGDT
jgi:hypothetical protein